MHEFPLLHRARQEQWDAARLAPYGTAAAASRGRCYAEAGDDPHTAFQRDRDRILHSAAFRRLQYKTQVYVFHEGDFDRTRLTHSLEVAQIAAALAHMVGANPDLAWAISLAHDLGHPPFGHGGEDELNELMAADGGVRAQRPGVAHRGRAGNSVSRLSRAQLDVGSPRRHRAARDVFRQSTGAE